MSLNSAQNNMFVTIYLEGSRLQQADLVALGKVTEVWDLLGEVDHLPHGRGEAQGELLPDLLARLVGVHVGGGVHGTDLEGHTGAEGEFRDLQGPSASTGGTSKSVNHESLTRCALLFTQLDGPL